MDESGISLVFKWTTQHGHAIISASSHQVYVMLEIAQTMPLWNFHHRFCNLNLFCFCPHRNDGKMKIMKGKIIENGILWQIANISIWICPMAMFIETVLTVRGCDTGTPTVRAIKLTAITMNTATIDQIFIFLDFIFWTIARKNWAAATELTLKISTWSFCFQTKLNLNLDQVGFGRFQISQLKAHDGKLLCCHKNYCIFSVIKSPTLNTRENETSTLLRMSKCLRLWSAVEFRANVLLDSPSGIELFAWFGTHFIWMCALQHNTRRCSSLSILIHQNERSRFVLHWTNTLNCLLGVYGVCAVVAAASFF